MRVLKWSNSTTLKLRLDYQVLFKRFGMDRENNDIGVIVRNGKYGGAFTHKDIAIEFGSATSVPFKLYLINEFAPI